MDSLRLTINENNSNYFKSNGIGIKNSKKKESHFKISGSFYKRLNNVYATTQVSLVYQNYTTQIVAPWSVSGLL